MTTQPPAHAPWSMLVMLAAALPVAAQTGITTRVSVSSTGVEANFSSSRGRLSADGRYAAFVSGAANLVPGDSNGLADVFVHDRATGATERVSVSSTGAQANSASDFSALSDDGRRIAFHSDASNLVANDTNGVRDVFVRDRAAGATTRVNVDSSGVQANALSSDPALSGDGRFVAFFSDASNLVVGDTNGFRDVFVHDLDTGVTERVSVGPGGAQANSLSGTTPSISANGRFVAFQSHATNLVAGGDVNGFPDIFVRDRLQMTTALVSVSSTGGQGNQGSFEPSISADGLWAAYTSASSNLVVGDVNNVRDIFVSATGGGSTSIVSVSSSAVQGNMESRLPWISGDGRYVVFESQSSTLVAGDANGRFDIFLRDRIAGSTRRVSVSSAGTESNGDSFWASIARFGLDIAFQSGATDLVPGDTNAVVDIFVHDHDGWPQPAIYCTAGTTSNGCVPSMGYSGTPSASASAGFTLGVGGSEGQKSGLFFYGLSGPSASPWGGGTSYLCAKAPTQRTGTQNSGGTNGACDGSYALDWNAYRSTNPAALGSPFLGGETVQAQAWFRDPPAPKTTNLSDAVSFVVCP